MLNPSSAVLSIIDSIATFEIRIEIVMVNIIHTCNRIRGFQSTFVCTDDESIDSTSVGMDSIGAARRAGYK